jgi:hypothetical protein
MSNWEGVRSWLASNWVPLVGMLLCVVVVVWHPSEDRLKALAAFAWPIAVVVCCLFFRAPITRLIDRIKKFGKDGFECGEMQAPQEKAVALTAGGAKGADPTPPAPVAIKNVLSEPARKLLATLGFYQRQHFQDRRDIRWWMQVPRESMDWPTFEAGAPELLRAGLIVAEPPNWKTYLTPAGLAFCAANRVELDAEPRIDRFGPG